ncbi:exodeoxyribonuclease V subunit gamma [Paraburkholderia bonniea]|uniref:exodeoxyribonuclease V subunit gamma n=1 Tax=Paraburkholderia bonniea TaxID=2152891 RepID=UPI0012923B6C|nr:exodeoxyribonuclease V subunit gamma [Paraburkholderia bonniea]WJF91250.1 exodeoxyribonuclease V subunit gamma [Paraburkholderia bonniea]WJF94565.1 exodeoxyribonuclease V subunit gamma [Paraburkholderia bonniea]
MLEIFYSNRYETLLDALLADLSQASPGPWSAQPVIVASAAMRRNLELALAEREGICANFEFGYLAQWLWARIGGVIPVPAQSPFAPDRLVWRCYRLLGAAAGADDVDGADETAPWRSSQRLRSYLDAADAPMRYELARRVATVFDHYLTYRPEWLLHWQKGGSIFAGGGALEGGPQLAGAGAAAREDERWQAALWRALLAELAGDAHGTSKGTSTALPPAYRFLAEIAQYDLDTLARARWPGSVSILALPTMPPLHVALLRELSRWIDVRLYVINPCREFWFDIVSQGRLEALDVAGQRDFQEVGHPLLAQWGRQTQAQLHMLHELTERTASVEAAHYTPNPAPTWLAAIQNAMLDLSPEDSSDAPVLDAGIEVHVCHSLSRQLEVLHDRLLDWFEAYDDLQPSDVLVAFPDLGAASPLIDAIFGAEPGADTRRIPYRITGLPPSQANPLARVLLDWLALAEFGVNASALIEWLRVDAIAARYGIDAAALETVQGWLLAAGARRGFAPAVSLDPAVPPARHTFADALMRLFLGYAMPEGAEPVAGWLPVDGADEGSDAQLLGCLTRFIDDLEAFAAHCANAHTPAAWSQLLLETLTTCFDDGINFAAALAEVRAAIDAMGEAMHAGAAGMPLPAAVVRAALAEALDDPARGGVPWGSVTFSSLTSLRGLPYRIVCLLGMDDGMLPSLARADEFDLMAAFSRPGDRQRRDDERNLFLDLLLAARDHLLLAYTGRSIRDNAPLPPAALVDELLDHLGAIVAGEGASPSERHAARQRFIVEHPLQPFAADYFSAGGALFSYDRERARLAGLLADPARIRLARPFFTQPLPAINATELAFDDLQRFWRHPARALLRDRLGIVLWSEAGELPETEPFDLDYAGRDALASRLLPVLLEAGTGPVALERVQRLAAASPELPGGATGKVWQSREIDALHRLALGVQHEMAGGVERVPFVLEVRSCWPETDGVALFGEHDEALRAAAQGPVQLHGTLNVLSQTGQIIFRYARPTARDYLFAWLAHLAYCAVRPDGPCRTVWYGLDERFEFTPVEAPQQQLASLVALFRAGQQWPLAFFPKSAWAKINDGASAARSVWLSDRVRGEADDPVLRLAWRGLPLTLDDALDEPFSTLAGIVFEPLVRHLQEA